MDLTRNPPVAHDPHARAYRVLFNEDSVRIAKLLGGAPAHLRHDCLSCHAVPGTDPHVIPDSIAEGVGCAACHGADEKWLTVHYLPGWKQLSNRQKADYGFTPTKNLVARVSACAACHVGDSTREVNHDLIAAGHPRLNFEYTRFHFSPAYRKHWADPEPDRVTKVNEFEVRAWAIGQVASLRAAADLLRARAEKAGGTWPEFAGHSCYACHQTVGDRDPRGVAGPTRALGWPAWEPWYTTAVPAALAVGKDMAAGLPTDVGEKLVALQKVMNRPESTRERGRGDARAAAAALVGALDRWLAVIQVAEDNHHLALPTDTPARVAVRLAGSATGATEWDELAQQYLGCAAAYHATGGHAGHPDWTEPLTAIKTGLAFPRSGGVRWDSPVGFDRDKMNQVRMPFLRLTGGNGTPGGDR
ncbi:hypothetical protein J0H58_02990 [bacterium]|nr:hypothetical protein [bacterium]